MTPAILEELTRLGYVEGRNLLIERYSGEGRAAHYPDLARQIIGQNPDLIIAISSNLTLDFKAATSTVPIVGIFQVPVESGIVRSLARPGGNITGVSIDVGFWDQWAKRVQLLKEAVPQITRLGLLGTRNAWERSSAAINEGELKNSVSVVGPPLERPVDEKEYQRVFAALAQADSDSLYVADEPENVTYRRLIVDMAAKGRLPTIYPWCQRRSNNASAGRSKSTSAKLVRRPPEPGALGLGIRLGSDYPPAYPSWQGVGVACSD